MGTMTLVWAEPSAGFCTHVVPILCSTGLNPGVALMVEGLGRTKGHYWR